MRHKFSFGSIDRLPECRKGCEIAEINAAPDAELVRFSNGGVMRKGEEAGGMRDDIWRM